MRMRGMPSFCITAQRTPGEGWSKLMEDLTDLRKVLPEASGTAGFANIRLRRIVFMAFAKKLRQLSTISMARRVISVTRSTVGFVES